MINNVVVISDLHAGCKLALCPPSGAALDDGGRYMPSALQLKLHAIWLEFWNQWVPRITKGEKFAVVVNGDTTDGVHHKSTTQISHNLEDQSQIAFELLEPVVKRCQGRFYMTRGTEAHVGSSGVEEERLAKRLGAKPNEVGQHARHELWLQMNGPRSSSGRSNAGRGNSKSGLVHFAHHIGTTGSMAYETSAVMKEISEMFADSARWRNQVPDVVVRSHRHRHIEVRIPTDRGYGISFVTAAWQLKTPFAYRIPGGRVSQPQVGGSLIRHGDQELFTAHFVRDIQRPPAVRP